MLNETRQALEQAFSKRDDELSSTGRVERLVADRLDLSEVLLERRPGHLHLVTQVRDELEDVFLGMGYEIAEGPEVESEWYNFTALNMPRHHSARSIQDSFYLDIGDKETWLLRSQTSPVQIRLLERGVLPIYTVAPGRVYRRDTPDNRHLPIFHQIEGMVVDEGVTFADLAGTIETFIKAIFGARRLHAPSAGVLSLHRAVGGVGDHLHDLSRSGLSDLLAHRLDRARRLRDGPSGGLRGDRRRSGALDRLRVRFRHRPVGVHAP